MFSFVQRLGLCFSRRFLMGYSGLAGFLKLTESSTGVLLANNQAMSELPVQTRPLFQKEFWQNIQTASELTTAVEALKAEVQYDVNVNLAVDLLLVMYNVWTIMDTYQILASCSEKKGAMENLVAVSQT